jgi:putative spermidine/putrescine transport system ATP-binding protein
MTKLSISGLTKRFAEVVAVDTIDLEIGEGELVSLLGPSGCGKTTTLRCIAGFEEPDGGSIRFNGEDIVGLPPERRNIGMVFQNYALFPHMTVLQNLGFGLEMRKVPAAEAKERIAKVLDTVQLTGLEDRHPRQLSGGQQQRVALGRALVIEPRVLLLDEPLANLDAKLREEMRFFIRSLQKRVGITTVYVTHDQSEAMVISDRIVVMFAGEIRQIGTPGDIYGQPVTREVADFIGLSNFIRARVRGSDGNAAYLLDAPLGQVHCHYEGALAEGEEVTVVVRPEAIRIDARRPAGSDLNVVMGTVVERYYLGNVVAYKVRCAEDSIVQVQEEPWMRCAVGDVVWLWFPQDRAWIIRD